MQHLLPRKSILIFLFVGLVSNIINGQNECRITDHFDDFIKISIYPGDKPYLSKGVTKTSGGNCYSESIDSNSFFFDYLLTHFSFNPNVTDLKQIEDSLQLRVAYLNKLKEDSLYNAVMNEWVQKTIDHSGPKDTVTWDKVLNIAVKYFSIMKINDAGHYVGKICTGINDIKKTEEIRKPFIEAFCFASIVYQVQGPESNIYKDFVSGIKQLYTVNMGIDPNERLLRAQGAMYMLMRNSESLKTMLKDEYERRKQYLPFIIQPDNT